MKAEDALKRMKLPKDKRGPRGIFQIWVTRACDKSCFGCTQGSNLAGRPGMITPEQFETACLSMAGYFGVVAMFGGNPCIHPQFEELCAIARRHIPYKHRGIWTNALLGKGKVCRETFNPAASNFNVHLDKKAAAEFRRDWPEAARSGLKGLDHDCSHSPPYVAMKDVLRTGCAACSGEGAVCDPPIEEQERQAQHELELGMPGPRWLTKKPCSECNSSGEVYDEELAWELISNCDINQRWSAMIGVFRGELRGWFCEVAGAQSMLHQHEPNYPDTGVPISPGWWRQGMKLFEPQIHKHCHECGVPLRGRGTLAVHGSREQVSHTHLGIYRPKIKGREVEIVVSREQLAGTVPHVTDYLANYKCHEK